MFLKLGRYCSSSLKNKLTCISRLQLKYLSSKQEAELEVEAFKLHCLSDGPSERSFLSRTDALKLYEDMVVVRRMESATIPLYRERLIRGFLHLYLGQEAVCVGMKAAMRPDDAVTTAYRCHGWAYMMGLTVKEVMAELLGKVTGCSRGKGGSMHMYAPSFYGGGGIVGSHVPVGTGVAFQMKYNNKSSVSFTLYGDGAANQGQVFEAFNMAKLWNLPIIYVCENNQFGMGTHVERSSANPHYYTRCEYIPGIWVNGMDVLAAREATKFAINHVSSGNGPIIIEMDTYRYSGHSITDPGTGYRTREEVEEIQSTKDPIATFKAKIIENELATSDELKEIDKKIKSMVREAVEEAKSDKQPALEEIIGDVYVEPLRSHDRRVDPWNQVPIKNFGNVINASFK